MLHLGDLVPREPGWVFNRLLKLWIAGAVGDYVEPVAVAAILGDATLIGRQQNAAVAAARPFISIRRNSPDAGSRLVIS